MWNTLQKLAQHPVLRFLKTLCGDPVQLYTIMLVTTAMEYYHSGKTWVYTIICIFLTFVLSKFYDFVAKHRFIGPLAYLGFLVLGLYAVSICVDIGYQDYPIYFLVWFLTPQSVMDFSLWYTIAIFLLMTGFLSSAVYYFGKVRYRMVMQFLIMLIPLSLYAKEGLQMDALLVIILLASYFLLMIYCRQLRESPDVRRLNGLHSNLSVAVYVTIFSILAAVVPKPHINADREFIENAMGNSSLSDMLLEAISVFTDTTNNSVMFSSSGRTLYYLNATESLHLRTQTYSYYTEDDTWHKETAYDYPIGIHSGQSSPPRMLLQGLLDAAKLDADFAAAHGLTNAAGTQLPEQRLQSFTLLSNIWYTTLLPSPVHTAAVEQVGSQPFSVTAQNVFALEEDELDYRVPVAMTYYSSDYAKFEAVSSILREFAPDDYSTMLADAAAILSETDAAAAEYLLQAREEYLDAQEYLALTQELDFQSDAVAALAQELTAPYDSDFEKACAIERYFSDAGFVYDLRYEKPEGDNVEEFLLTTQRGICYEFATAMVLLCRSAGLPARYVEGFSMSEQYDGVINNSQITHVVRARDAHGYPEVYIEGYGWLDFEPTVAANEQIQEKTAENYYVMLWGFVLLGLALLALLGYLLMPHLLEYRFRKNTAKLMPEQAAAAIFKRMRRICGLPESATVMELAAQPYGAPDVLFDRIDKLLYAQDSGAATEELMQAYVQWRQAKTAYEKEMRKKEKQK